MTRVLLSTIVGFGAGHYYAGRPLVGNPFAFAQSGGLVLGGVGAALIADANRRGAELTDRQTHEIEAARSQLYAGETLLVGGLVVFTLDRLIDIVQAPRSARKTRTAL